MKEDLETSETQETYFYGVLIFKPIFKEQKRLRGGDCDYHAWVIDLY